MLSDACVLSALASAGGSTGHIVGVLELETGIQWWGVGSKQPQIPPSSPGHILAPRPPRKIQPTALQLRRA